MADVHHPASPEEKGPGSLVAALGLLYALSGFLIALAAFLYAIPFLANFKLGGVPVVSPTIDIGGTQDPAHALAIDLGLILLFGVQHSVMARDGFKGWLLRHLPGGLERATYVHASNLVFWAVLLLWQPVPTVLVDMSGARAVMTTIFLLGWLMVLIASLNIDLLDLWGLRQASSWSQGKTYEPPPFKERWLYRQVRHPIYSALILAFWATPVLTVGHALFAAAMTAYMVIGARFEERDLVRKHGQSYRSYQRAVPAFLPRLGLRAAVR